MDEEVRYLRCTVACSSLKDVEEIGNNKMIFRGKHVAGMQGELDVSISTVDTPSDQVDISTTRIDTGETK